MNRKFINLNGDEGINQYLKEIRKTTPITAKREIQLAKLIQEGNQSAIDELVLSNLKFVVSIAKEYQGQGLGLADLINEGNYGLIKAATKFDHTKGFRFISYAVWWIKQSIIQSLNDNARLIRLPANMITKLATLKKEIDKFKTENEREPVYGDVVGETFDNIGSFEKHSYQSLNELINEDGLELYETIENPLNTNDYENYDIDDNVKNELDNTLLILDDRERKIVEYYFGLDTNYAPMTLEEIGDIFGLTKERIRQIKNMAIRKLRFNSEGLFKSLNN